MNTIESKFLSLSGRICTLTYRRPCKTVSTFLGTLEKLTRVQCRGGVAFDNIGLVQEKREDGTYPAENQGLPWGNWKVYPYIIENKGKEFYRFSILHDGLNEVTYILNGAVTRKEDIEKYLVPSELAVHTSEIFNVNKDYIQDLI